MQELNRFYATMDLLNRFLREKSFPTAMRHRWVARASAAGTRARSCAQRIAEAPLLST